MDWMEATMRMRVSNRRSRRTRSIPTNSGQRTRGPSLHSNQSPLGAVSVAGKRNFEARDKGAEIALGSRCGHSQRPSASAQARQFGGLRQNRGNLRSAESAWWGWEDSN
jgi:hypothetical protein